MASIEYVVNASGTLGAFLEKAGLSVDRLNEDLDRLSRQVATPAVDLEDKDAVLKMARIAQQLDKLKAKVADPKVELDKPAYERMRLQILRLDAQLDRLNHKHVTAHVDVDVDRRGLRGLLSRLGGSATGEKGVFGGAGGFLSSPLGIGGIGAAGLLAAALAPSVIGLGLGGLGGLGAIGGGMFGASQGNKIIAADQAQIKTITAALKNAIGKQKTELSHALKDEQKQLTKDTNFYAPFIALQGSLKDLLTTFIKPLRPVMQPLIGIITQFGKGLTGLGPLFTQFFKASLPFIRMFAQLMLQSGKILLPAFTQALQEMVKSGALKALSEGLVILVQGLATFIRNLGPGMRASAEIFKGVMKVVAGILGFLGDLFTTIAKVLNYRWGNLWHDLTASAKAFWHAIVDSFHAFWHTIAASFDAFRHLAATIWDTIWRNTITRAKNGISDVVGFVKGFWRTLSSVFDTIRHGIATAWDTIWRNTVTRVRNGIEDVVRWFKGLPGRAINALMGLGTMLWNFGHMAFTKFWNGLKSVGGTIFNWLKGFAHGVVDIFKKVWHWFSPSGVMYSAGRDLMLGLFHGIKDHAHKAQNAFGGAINFKAGAGVQQWAPLVRRALAMEHLSPLLVGRVLYQMQTESGGNPNIVNNWDSNAQRGTPSKGLMQVIGPTFSAYHWPGTSWNIFNPLANIAAALNYARHVYGPSLMSGGMGIGSGHGYALGGVITEPIWGVGASGRSYTFGERGPETVIPGTGRGAGTVININVAAGPGTNRRQLAQEIADVILEHTRTGGRLYPKGVSPK